MVSLSISVNSSMIARVLPCIWATHRRGLLLKSIPHTRGLTPSSTRGLMCCCRRTDKPHRPGSQCGVELRRQNTDDYVLLIREGKFTLTRSIRRETTEARFSVTWARDNSHVKRQTLSGFLSISQGNDCRSAGFIGNSDPSVAPRPSANSGLLLSRRRLSGRSRCRAHYRLPERRIRKRPGHRGGPDPSVAPSQLDPVIRPDTSLGEWSTRHWCVDLQILRAV